MTHRLPFGLEVLVCCLIVGCGGSSATDGGGAGGTGTGGSSQSGGVGGTAGDTNAAGSGASAGNGASSGSGGTGGATGTGGTAGDHQGPPCPTEPPATDDGCENPGQLCAYQQCDGEGLIEARCGREVWSVSTSTCETTVCGNYQCDAGQLCLEIQSGALMIECVENPCGTGPLDCACACGGMDCTIESATKVTCRSGCTDCP